jgi:hypothetical protein
LFRGTDYAEGLSDVPGKSYHRVPRSREFL